MSAPLLIGTTVATLVVTGSSKGAAGLSYEGGWAGEEERAVVDAETARGN